MDAADLSAALEALAADVYVDGEGPLSSREAAERILGEVRRQRLLAEASPDPDTVEAEWYGKGEAT